LALPESAGAMNHAVAMAMECHEPRSAAMSIEESTDAKAWIPLDPVGSPWQIQWPVANVAVIAPGAELAKTLAETALEASLFMVSQILYDLK